MLCIERWLYHQNANWKEWENTRNTKRAQIYVDITGRNGYNITVVAEEEATEMGSIDVQDLARYFHFHIDKEKCLKLNVENAILTTSFIVWCVKVFEANEKVHAHTHTPTEQSIRMVPDSSLSLSPYII